MFSVSIKKSGVRCDVDTKFRRQSKAGGLENIQHDNGQEGSIERKTDKKVYGYELNIKIANRKKSI